MKHASAFLTSKWICLLAISSASQLTSATTWCVGQASGCPNTTIGAAVAAASAGDIVQVQPGVYSESVVINKPLSLVGIGGPIINAFGGANGIFVSGTNSAPLNGVIVSGFTIENANFEGILVTNASEVTIANNLVMWNNRSLNTTNLAALTCPGLPAFDANEGYNCGAGIHLIAVDHSTVAKNVVTNNAGGILVTDETGPSCNNVVSANNVNNNLYDAGITLASYPPYPGSGLAASSGVHHNSISGNTSSSNGITVPGAGIAILAPSSGSQAYGNVIVNNTLSGNGSPGLILRNAATASAGQTVNLNDNVILNNQIAGNAADIGAAVTSGSTGISIYSVVPIKGTIIAQNTVVNEQIDIAVNTPSSEIMANLNNLYAMQAIDNMGAGNVTANDNYFGCSSGPGQGGCGAILGAVVACMYATAPF